MGGPQSPDFTLAECAYFDSKAEQAVIASAVKVGKAAIGVCLGSQLIGEALGAPGLTPDAEIIAWSKGCPRQIVAYSELVYGFQCHMELTSDVVEMLIAHSEKDLSRAAEYRFVNTAEMLRAWDYSEMNRVLFTFLDKLAAKYLSGKSSGTGLKPQ